MRSSSARHRELNSCYLEQQGIFLLQLMAIAFCVWMAIENLIEPISNFANRASEVLR